MRMKVTNGNASVRIFYRSKIMFRCMYRNGVFLETPFIKEAFLFLLSNKI
jgi:hypothetical protein